MASSIELPWKGGYGSILPNGANHLSMHVLPPACRPSRTTNVDYWQWDYLEKLSYLPKCRVISVVACRHSASEAGNTVQVGSRLRPSESCRNAADGKLCTAYGNAIKGVAEGLLSMSSRSSSMSSPASLLESSFELLEPLRLAFMVMSWSFRARSTPIADGTQALQHTGPRRQCNFSCTQQCRVNPRHAAYVCC